ncbi:unnamed protein product [Clonostachys rosea]|uniref:Transcription factor domain-containing protein n=1 Tax=Bionectria ochroleuca TaxID=29856 RepID=A0ABY6UG74_BIOOC|nr:unnamed protein product [Clonostachys rosea]
MGRLGNASTGGFVYGLREQRAPPDHEEETLLPAAAFDLDTPDSGHIVSPSQNQFGAFGLLELLPNPLALTSEAGEVTISLSSTGGKFNGNKSSVSQEIVQTTAAIPQSLDPVALLPPTAQYLLQYYLSQTIRLTVPSDYARDEICRFVLPMALENRPLLFAIMTFAAVHLHSHGMLLGEPEKLIDKLERSSIQSLQPKFHDRDPVAQAMSLTTTRTLCQAMIYRGTSSWRVHLDNARFILRHAHFRDNSATQNCSCSAIHGFLSSWYDNTEALAALTPLGLRHGQLEAKCLRSVDVQFDVFGGTASDLPGLLREVGAMVKEKRSRHTSQLFPTGSLNSILSDSDIDLEAQALVREVRRRLERDTVSNLVCDRHLPAALSGDDVQDYVLSNAGYLYTALLYIYCGIQALPISSPEVQEVVSGLVWCSQNMKRSAGFSPRVLLVTPLFTAGLCAKGTARADVKAELEDIGKWVGMPHIPTTLSILEGVWATFDGDPGNEDVWSYFETTTSDFITY